MPVITHKGEIFDIPSDILNSHKILEKFDWEEFYNSEKMIYDKIKFHNSKLSAEQISLTIEQFIHMSCIRVWNKMATDSNADVVVSWNNVIPKYYPCYNFRTGNMEINETRDVKEFTHKHYLNDDLCALAVKHFGEVFMKILLNL
jgi:hypothetical protein